MQHSRSEELLIENSRYIPGGMVSLNRRVEPHIAFTRGQGATLWDADGNTYLDFHAAFAPYLLGHGDRDVEGAVVKAIRDGWTLTGSGTTSWEGRAAELLVKSVASLDMVQFTTTGSESTYHALRLSRTFTGRDHIVVMQGGYNGWHDEVACNVMTPLSKIGPRQVKGEYPFVPMTAGLPHGVEDRVHVINFNDLESLEWVFQTYPVACILSEPILQNIGIVLPLEGYLKGIRELCDRYGVVWVMDEVKTGFRHALGGYQSIAGVTPDLSVFGKAIANGYPVGAIGGRRDIMQLFDAADEAKRVLIAGTYNGHPVTIAAAITTMEKLHSNGAAIYEQLEALGSKVQSGLQQIFAEGGITATIVRQGSAWCVYFMDHQPRDWHDIAENHDMALDVCYRRALVEQGIYQFPLPTKQASISAAHTAEDIERLLDATRQFITAYQNA